MTGEEEFSIKCHATLNSGRSSTTPRTPPGLIAWHEARSNLGAPADAHTWTLADVNLYFSAAAASDHARRVVLCLRDACFRRRGWALVAANGGGARSEEGVCHGYLATRR